MKVKYIILEEDIFSIILEERYSKENTDIIECEIDFRKQSSLENSDGRKS